MDDNHTLFSLWQTSNEPGFMSEQTSDKFLLSLLGWDLGGDYVFQCHLLHLVIL